MILFGDSNVSRKREPGGSYTRVTRVVTFLQVPKAD